MTSFLPVFRISATVELDRRGRRKFPRDARVAGSTGDSHDDADRGGERGRLLARLPATELREATVQLRVHLARDRDLDDRPIGRIEPARLGGAEPRDELGETAKGELAIAHRQLARHVGWRERGRRARRRACRPLSFERIGAQLGLLSGPGPNVVLGSPLTLRSRRGGLELADDRRLPVLTLRGLLKLRVARGGRGLRSAPRRRLGPLLVRQSAGLRGFREPLDALLRSRRRLRLLRLSRWVLLACLLVSPGAVKNSWRVVLPRRRWRFGRRDAGRLGDHGRGGLLPGRLLQLGRSAIHQGYSDGDEHDGRGLHGKLHRPWHKEAAQETLRPGHRPCRLEHAVDEAGRRAYRRRRAHQRDGVPETLELAPTVGARRQMRVELGALRRIERVVDQRRELFARVVAGHGRNRSSFSRKSIRARWSLDLTVPSSSSSASAISSYDSPSRSRRTTTIRRSSPSSAIARCRAVSSSLRSASSAGLTSREARRVSASSPWRATRRSPDARRFRHSREAIA